MRESVRPGVCLAALRDSEQGSVAIMAGAVFALLFSGGVVAVDLGIVYTEKARAQGAVDLAALSAVRNLDNPDELAETVIRENGVDVISDLMVRVGRYEPDPTRAPADRFVEGGMPSNAVKVELVTAAPVFFGARFTDDGRVPIAVEAVATTTDLAEFSVGSRLLSVQDGVANSVLKATLGTNVSLTAVDYRALASADIDLFQSMSSLATEADIDAVTYDDVLAAEVSYSEFVDAMGEAAAGNGNPGLTAALNHLASLVGSSPASLSLAELIDLGPYGGEGIGSSPPIDGSVGALPTLMAAALIAGGDNQVSLNMASAFPGLLTARVDLKVGERPQGSSWLTVGPEDTIVRTAQVRLGIEVAVGGTGLLNSMRVSLPVLAEVAQAEAQLTDVACSGLTPDEVSVAVTPGVANVWIGSLASGQLRDLTPQAVRVARLVDTPLVSASGQAHLEIADQDAETLVFSASDIEQGVVKTAGTEDLASSAISSLLGDLTLDMRVLVLPLNLTRDAIRLQLSNLATPAGTLLVSVLDVLGVGVGEADLQVHGIRCGGPGLVG